MVAGCPPARFFNYYFSKGLREMSMAGAEK
jgi:hypothetical protein